MRFKFLYGEAGDVRDLFITALLKNLQRKYEPLVFIERGQRAVNQLVQLFTEKLIDRNRSLVTQIEDRLVIEVNMPAIPRAGPQRFARHVPRDTEKPGRKLRLLTQVRQIPKGPYE